MHWDRKLGIITVVVLIIAAAAAAGVVWWITTGTQSSGERIRGRAEDGYAELIRNVNKNFSPTEIKKEEGLVYIEYEFHNEEENQTYKYLTVMYEQGGGIFWTVQFATIKADFDSLRPDLIEWAKSVKFA